MSSQSRERNARTTHVVDLGRALASGGDTAELVRSVVGTAALEDHELQAVVREPGSGYYVCHDSDGAVTERLKEKQLAARFDAHGQQRLAVPVTTDSTLFGFVVVERDGAEVSLTPDQLQLLVRVADHLAVALECAPLDAHARMLIGRRLMADGPRCEALARHMAQLAHDIRSPLSAIVMQVELLTLDQDSLTDTLRRALRRISESAEDLGQVVEESIGPDRRSPGGTPDLSPQALARIADDAIARLCREDEPIANSIDDSIEGAFEGSRVQRILELLISNAQQHGAAPISLACETIDGAVVVQVADHGMGVSPEDAENIFQPFFSTDDGVGGTGLAIARQLARTLGGDVYLHCGEPGNCVFALRLPNQPAP